jgi:hypothetical protein
MRMRISTLAFALLLPACVVTGEIDGVSGGDDEGGGGGGGGDGSGSGSGGGSGTQNTPHIIASIDKTSVTTELGKTETIAVTLQSMNQFTGTVTLTPTVMDGATPVAGWTFTTTPSNIVMQADATQAVMLAVNVPTDTASLAPTVKIDVTSSAATVNVSSTFAVTNQYTIAIPAATGAAAPHAGLPAPNQTLRLRSGAKVIFHNSDTVAHQIHASGGIPHQGGALNPNADYVVTPSDSATWYCHTHEGGGSARPILLE